MTISSHATDTVGQLPQRPSAKAFGQLATTHRSLAYGYYDYATAVGSFAPDPSVWDNVRRHFARARALSEDPSTVWDDLTKTYRVDDKPAGWAVLQASARPSLADSLARATGWTDNDAAAAAAVAERTGNVGLSISAVDQPPTWKVNTCHRVRAALVKISAARKKFAAWIVQNIGQSERAQQLARAVNELEDEIAKLAKWEAIFKQQEVDAQRPH